jgi:hypothetical protein
VGLVFFLLPGFNCKHVETLKILMPLFRLCLWACLLLIAQVATAATSKPPILVLDDTSTQVSLYPYVEIAEGPTGSSAPGTPPPPSAFRGGWHNPPTLATPNPPGGHGLKSSATPRNRSTGIFYSRDKTPTGSGRIKRVRKTPPSRPCPPSPPSGCQHRN